MHKELIEKLSNLQMKERYLKRYLDINYYDEEKRNFYFDEIRKVKDEIRKVNFMLRLNKEKKNVENSNTIEPNN